ncbi:S41 family peptidase [Angelakisella massiliensis]|uniref:S41 family peptidase n=1 Tax=Angelakisella massiliensis TaxID=1871018 RepID=UPI0024B1C68D|nr:S41 family peptidase [Angelakisella massiliensis]
MNKKISLGAAIAYMALVAAVVFAITSIRSANIFNDKLKNLDEREATYDKLSEIDRYVRDNYYGDIDEDALLSGAAAGYISGLGDPYARYLTPKEYEAYQKTDDGQYVGIGVVTELSEDGYIRLRTVYPDSPAASVGLQEGDIIISVDGEPARADNYAALTAAFKGNVGTKLTLVKRQDNNETTLEITRSQVNTPTVTSQNISGSGYIRFSNITAATAEQLDRAVRQLTQEGVSALIFDLRGVSSSNAEYVMDMLELFCPKGDIACSKAKDGTLTSLGESDGASYDLPMAVLVDDTTVGTPELFALVIQQNSKGKVVGLTTAGQGSIQKDYKLIDGSGLVLTTALYATTDGETYNGVGVSPDYRVKLNVADSERANIYGVQEVDTQLGKALEVVTVLAKTENAVAGSTAVAAD